MDHLQLVGETLLAAAPKGLTSLELSERIGLSEKQVLRALRKYAEAHVAFELGERRGSDNRKRKVWHASGQLDPTKPPVPSVGFKPIQRRNKRPITEKGADRRVVDQYLECIEEVASRMLYLTVDPVHEEFDRRGYSVGHFGRRVVQTAANRAVKNGVIKIARDAPPLSSQRRGGLTSLYQSLLYKGPIPLSREQILELEVERLRLELGAVTAERDQLLVASGVIRGEDAFSSPVATLNEV